MTDLNSLHSWAKNSFGHFPDKVLGSRVHAFVFQGAASLHTLTAVNKCNVMLIGLIRSYFALCFPQSVVLINFHYLVVLLLGAVDIIISMNHMCTMQYLLLSHSRMTHFYHLQQGECTQREFKWINYIFC